LKPPPYRSSHLPSCDQSRVRGYTTESVIQGLIGFMSYLTQNMQLQRRSAQLIS